MSDECFGCGHPVMDCTCHLAGRGEDDARLHWSVDWSKFLIGVDLSGWQRSAHIGPVQVWWWYNRKEVK